MKPTHGTQLSSRSDPAHIAAAAAWLAIFGTGAAILLLGALHVLSPEFSPSWRMISEYAFGHYSWVLSLMFLSSGIGTWGLVIALNSEVHTKPGKLGLYFLMISGFGSAMASYFDVMHEIGHAIAGLLGVLSFPMAALLLSAALGKNETWQKARKPLLWLANLSWISVVLLVVTLAIMAMQVSRLNGGHLPQHAPKSLPSGVLPLAGWADRLIVLSDWAWVLLAAWKAMEVRRTQSSGDQLSRSSAVVKPDFGSRLEMITEEHRL